MSQSYLTAPHISHEDPEELISTNVLSVYSSLNHAIETMHKKVEHVLQKHQSQFLFAYRNHVKRIKKELQEIKTKSQEQEKMFSANDRIKFLEKEVVVFREESLKLYDKLEKITSESQFYRKKYEDLAQQLHFSETTARESLKNTKNIEKEKLILENKIQKLENELKEKDIEIQKLQNIERGERNKIHEKSFDRNLYNLTSLGSDRSRRTRYAPETLNKSQSFMKKTFRLKESITTEDNEFREYFFECLNTVKKEIAYRKGNQINPSQIKDISQLREIDKIRIIQMFFANEKLQSMMLEKLFPNSFLKNKIVQADSEQKSPFLLPKVSFQKTKRNFASNLSMI